MLSRRSNQRGLFEGDHLWLDHVGRRSFYGVLAGERGQLFRDDDFAELYSLTNGRPSVPPSPLATALLPQTHERCQERPADASHWSTRTMARATGMSQTAVSRIWRTFGLQPHREETFKLSTDPQFIEKLRDVVGLYLDPSQAAVVFCVDEMS
jgi:hypothetical protein